MTWFHFLWQAQEERFQLGRIACVQERDILPRTLLELAQKFHNELGVLMLLGHP